MRQDMHPVVEQLEAAAKAAQSAETRLRAEMAREIARVERERIFAFRRARFVRLLADAAASVEEGDDMAGAQRRAVAGEFGWDCEGERHREVLDRAVELGAALLGADGSVDSGGVFAAALKQFEDWYQAQAGEPFYNLFDQYVPEAPLVDF